MLAPLPTDARLCGLLEVVDGLYKAACARGDGGNRSLIRRIALLRDPAAAQETIRQERFRWSPQLWHQLVLISLSQLDPTILKRLLTDLNARRLQRGLTGNPWVSLDVDEIEARVANIRIQEDRIVLEVFAACSRHRATREVSHLRYALSLLEEAAEFRDEQLNPEIFEAPFFAETACLVEALQQTLPSEVAEFLGDFTERFQQGFERFMRDSERALPAAIFDTGNWGTPEATDFDSDAVWFVPDKQAMFDAQRRHARERQLQREEAVRLQRERQAQKGREEPARQNAEGAAKQAQMASERGRHRPGPPVEARAEAPRPRGRAGHRRTEGTARLESQPEAPIRTDKTDPDRTERFMTAW